MTISQAPRSSPGPGHILAPIRQDRSVVVFTGWAGAGKTSSMRALISGLGGSGRSRTGVIVNEIGTASTRVDLERLSDDLAKRGIQGCACCASNAQVLAALDSFHKDGKALTLIEQSGLSRTRELVHTITAHGFRPFVIAAVNPRQTKGIMRYLVPHIRAADVVLITHCTPQSDAALIKQATSLVQEVTAGTNKRPILHVVGNVNEPFPSSIWNSAQESIAKVQGGRHGLVARTGSLLSSFTRRDSPQERAEEAARAQDVEQFTEIEVMLYPGLTPDRVVRDLSGLTRGDGKKVNIIRAKGVLGGSDIDVVADERGLVTKYERRQTASIAFGGSDYLVIRALDRELRSCWRYLATHLGTPECSIDAAKSVGALYPLRAQMELQLQEDGRIPVLFGADSLLWELSDSLGHITSIGDTTRRNQLVVSIATLLQEFLRVRVDLCDVLASQIAARSPDRATWLFDMWFVAARVLIHPQMGGMIQSQESLRRLATNLWSRRPIATLCESAISMRTLAINGRSDLSDADRAWMTLLLRAGIERRELTRERVTGVIASLKEKADRSANRSWSSGLLTLENELRN